MPLETEVFILQRQDPFQIASGGAVCITAKCCKQICFIAGTGCTITWSRVDSPTATAHGSNTATVTTGVVSTVAVDWPYYYVSAAGAAARVAVV